MRALLIFGKKFGADNAPLIELGKKIAGMGHQVKFAHWDDKVIANDFDEIDILGGHSYGGDVAIDLAQAFDLKYLFAIDPVAQWFPFNFPNYWKRFEIPSNVERCDSFTRALNVIPPAGTLKSTNEKHMAYTGLNSNHANMPANPFVVYAILNSIKSLE